ncbi:MAG: protease modulator HflC [Clostridia bacterium]|nr:protease modulator HflC [Clostridia bacterium]
MSKKAKKNNQKKRVTTPVIPEQAVEAPAQMMQEPVAAIPAPVGATPEQKKERSPLGVRIAKYATTLVVVLVLFWFGFTTVVKEGNCAVILRFGAVREEITEAGLYFKLPWPFESVVTYDGKLQCLEANRLETTTKDKRNVIIQSYVVWEIDNPVLYHNSVGSRGAVESYINDQIFSATNSVMGGYNLTALVSLDAEQIRIDQIQEEIFTRVRDNCLANYGINITDVSILRLSLPEANLDAVFEQMRADRQKDIDIILANAYLEANKITTKADADAAEITGQGVTDAAAIKAETEKAVAKIYNDAQAANIDLFKFLKNLDAMVASVNSSTVLIVDENKYPFNLLFDYADYTTEGTVLYDLSYILEQLEEPDRTELINAIADLIEQAASNGSGTEGSGTGT